MNNRIGFIGNRPELPRGSKGNTGNLIHGHAAHSLFKDPIKIQSADTDSNIATVRQSCEIIGFAAATVLHANRIPEYIASHVTTANFLEKAKLPVVAFGLGCQANHNQRVVNAEVDARSVRLLQVIAAHSHSIAVRGEFTADLCKKYGVKNVEVVGCQSAYLAGVHNWGQPFASINNPKRSVAHLTPGTDETHLIRIVIQSKSDIIGQGDPTEERITLEEIGRSDFIYATKSYWMPPYLQKLLGEGVISPDTYWDLIRTKFHKFYNVPDWVDHIRSNYDFAYGTRFHGGMAAFLAGIPSLWITHDMRTIDLCAHLRLPSIEQTTLSKAQSACQLMEQCDYSGFWSSFPRRLNEFMSYIRHNQVLNLIDNNFRTKAESIVLAQS